MKKAYYVVSWKMHNKVSCLPPRLLHRVHCRRTSLHFAAPSRVVVLVPVARRDPAHQSRVVIIPPVRWASSSPARLVSRVWSSSSWPVRRASSFRPFFGRRHPVRQSRVVVIQPVVKASSFRPSVGRRRPAVLGLLVRFAVVLMLSSRRLVRPCYPSCIFLPLSCGTVVRERGAEENQK